MNDAQQMKAASHETMKFEMDKLSRSVTEKIIFNDNDMNNQEALDEVTRREIVRIIPAQFEEDEFEDIALIGKLFGYHTCM